MRTNIRVVMQRLGIPIDEESAEYFDEMVNQGRLDLERYESLSPTGFEFGDHDKECVLVEKRSQ